MWRFMEWWQPVQYYARSLRIRRSSGQDIRHILRAFFPVASRRVLVRRRLNGPPAGEAVTVF